MTNGAGPYLRLLDLREIAKGRSDSSCHDRIIAKLKALGIYTVRLTPEHAEWVERMAVFEGNYRRLPDYTAEDFIELMVRAGFASDPGREFNRRRAVENDSAR